MPGWHASEQDEEASVLVDDLAGLVADDLGVLLASPDGLLGSLVLNLLLPGRQLGVELVIDHLSGVLDISDDLVLLPVELLCFVPCDQILQVELLILSGLIFVGI